jgi:hypothetical protein
VDAAAKVRDLNFKYMAEGKGATVTARWALMASPLLPEPRQRRRGKDDSADLRPRDFNR